MKNKVKHPGFRNFVRHYLLKVIFALIFIELVAIAYFQGRNQIPVAQNDEASASSGSFVDIPVMVNDTDEDIENDLKLDTVSNPEHGEAVIRNRVIRYTPNPDFAGNDKFTYTISDGKDRSKPAIVTITVKAEPAS